MIFDADHPWDIDMEGDDYLVYERVLLGRFRRMEDAKEAIEHRKIAARFPVVRSDIDRAMDSAGE